MAKSKKRKAHYQQLRQKKKQEKALKKKRKKAAKHKNAISDFLSLVSGVSLSQKELISANRTISPGPMMMLKKYCKS